MNDISLAQAQAAVSAAIEKSRELPFAFVGEIDEISRMRLQGNFVTQWACASVIRVGTATSSSGKRACSSPSSSSWTGPTAIPNTP